MAVLSDPMDRLHLVTPASTLGVTAACAAVVAREGLNASGTSAVLLAAVTVLTSPLVSHACARSIQVRRRGDEAGTESGLGRPGDAVIAVALLWVGVGHSRGVHP